MKNAGAKALSTEDRSSRRFLLQLLLDDILPYVDGHGENNNQTADDVLDIRVDAQELQGVNNRLHDNRTDDDTLDGTDTA